MTKNYLLRISVLILSTTLNAGDPPENDNETRSIDSGSSASEKVWGSEEDFEMAIFHFSSDTPSSSPTSGLQCRSVSLDDVAGALLSEEYREKINTESRLLKLLQNALGNTVDFYNIISSDEATEIISNLEPHSEMKKDFIATLQNHIEILPDDEQSAYDGLLETIRPDTPALRRVKSCTMISLATLN